MINPVYLEKIMPAIQEIELRTATQHKIEDDETIRFICWNDEFKNSGIDLVMKIPSGACEITVESEQCDDNPVFYFKTRGEAITAYKLAKAVRSALLWKHIKYTNHVRAAAESILKLG